jgi:hypothetical protein
MGKHHTHIGKNVPVIARLFVAVKAPKQQESSIKAV